MLDPITSLLATCANCNPTNASAEQPVITACDTGPRSSQAQSQPTALSTTCISPPEITPNSLPSQTRETAVAANREQTNLQISTHTSPRPVSPESMVLVSWSNASSNSVSNRAASTTANKPDNGILRLGSQGQAVNRLQTQLKQLGYYRAAVDGIYGQQTKAAVAQFQRSKGLQVDGVVGANTWAALRTVTRQSQSEKPPASTPAPSQPSSATARGDRPAAETPPSSTSSLLPAAPEPRASAAQVTRQTDSSPQSVPSYLWILGWGIIYGSGWFFILKDTVKELNGFHFVLATNKKKAKGTVQRGMTQARKDSKAVPQVIIHNVKNNDNVKNNHIKNEHHPLEDAPHFPIDPSSVQPSIDPSSVQLRIEAPNNEPKQDSDYSQDSDYPSGDLSEPANGEPVALDDPWQQEADEALFQVLEVALADDGQIQPIQNVFVVAPRPTRSRTRVKKPTALYPTSIYDVKAIRQRIKTG